MNTVLLAALFGLLAFSFFAFGGSRTDDINGLKENCFVRKVTAIRKFAT